MKIYISLLYKLGCNQLICGWWMSINCKLDTTKLYFHSKLSYIYNELFIYQSLIIFYVLLCISHILLVIYNAILAIHSSSINSYPWINYQLFIHDLFIFFWISSSLMSYPKMVDIEWGPLKLLLWMWMWM